MYNYASNIKLKEAQSIAYCFMKVWCCELFKYTAVHASTIYDNCLRSSIVQLILDEIVYNIYLTGGNLTGLVRKSENVMHASQKN